MANSNWFSTSNTYIRYRIETTLDSQNAAENSSTVTVKVFVERTNTGYETSGNGTCYCIIDGTTFTKSITNSQVIDENGLYLFSRTVVVYHDADGKKSLAISAKISHSRFSSDYNGADFALDSIARTSGLVVGNGTLGLAQNIGIVPASEGFTHTIRYACGSASGTIATKTTATTVTWVPSLELARQNVSGSSVSIVITLTAYSGESELGSASQTISADIPANIIPSCTIAVSDPTGLLARYGAYVQDKSRFAVSISPVIAYDAPISAYSAHANGTSYTVQNFTTNGLVYSGSQQITASVRDSRGRSSGTASQSVSILPYAVPRISSLYTTRCNADGTENYQGNYIRATFRVTVSPLNNRNSAKYVLEYKRSADVNYTAVTLTGYANQYDVSGTHIFAADSGSSFDVTLTVTDDFGSSAAFTTASTSFALMHFAADGRSMAVGKLSEHTGQFESALPFRGEGGYVAIELERGVNFNSLIVSGLYYGDPASGSYANCPVASGRITIEVVDSGSAGQKIQRVRVCATSSYVSYIRCFDGSSWGGWRMVEAADAATMRANLDITLAGLGAAPVNHNHSASNITSGVFGLERGGLGVTSASAMLNVLGIRHGRLTMTNAGSRTVSVDVSFGKTYSAAPNVVITPGIDGWSASTSSVNHFIGVTKGSITTTGFQIYWISGGSSSRSAEISWVAVGQ